MKKYIEFIYKFILAISIFIGICIFVKSRILGNKSEIEELIKYREENIKMKKYSNNKIKILKRSV